MAGYSRLPPSSHGWDFRKWQDHRHRRPCQGPSEGDPHGCIGHIRPRSVACLCDILTIYDGLSSLLNILVAIPAVAQSTAFEPSVVSVWHRGSQTLRGAINHHWTRISRMDGTMVAWDGIFGLSQSRWP